MKSVMKFGLVMAALFGMAVSAFASTADFSLRMSSAKGKQISFILTDASQVRLSVSDKDETLFSETLAGNGTIKRTYDLTPLADGKYSLIAETPSTISTYEIKIEGNKAELSDKAVEVAKPMIVAKNTTVSLSLINKFQTPVEVTIYDASDSEIHSETLAAKGVSTQRMYDFKNLPSGKYTFVTTFGNKTFTETVETK